MIFLATLVLVLLTVLIERRIYNRFGLRGLNYTLQLDRHEVYEGDAVHLIETLSNNKGLPVPWLKSELAVDPSFSFAGSSSVQAGGLQLVSGIFMLRPWHAIRREWDVTCTHFGIPQISKVLIVSNDLLGLVTLSTSLPVKETVTVLPRAIDTDDLSWEHRSIYGELESKRRWLQDPFLIRGIRDYTGLEPVRDIHWLASAQLQELVVRDYLDAADQSICLMINLEMQTISDDFARSELEYGDAVRIAVTLIRHATTNGLQVEMLVNGVVLNVPESLNYRLHHAGASYNAQRAAASVAAEIRDERLGSLSGRRLVFDPDHGSSEIQTAQISAEVERGEEALRYSHILPASGEEQALRLERFFARLDPLPSCRFVELLADQRNRLRASDLVILSPYIDEQMAAFASVQQGQGVDVRIALTMQGSDEMPELQKTLVAEGVQIVPLYRLSEHFARKRKAAGPSGDQDD